MGRSLILSSWIFSTLALAAAPENRVDGEVPPHAVVTDFSPEQESFWCFQPIEDSPIPCAGASDWPTTPIDNFVLARLKQEGFQPAPPAEKHTWLRRIYLDMLGLPPTPEDLDDFLADKSPHAKSKVVDRLLASPHYGERYARHWLDVARYADTLGQEADWVLRYAWRYRDYVIDAFNQDKPYSEFVIEQIAGDLLPTHEDPLRALEQIVATGFLMFSPKATAEADKELMVLDVVDEQIDVTCRAFLGLTVACARCHDHKFDPIPTIDYYSLAGIFRSTRTMVDKQSTSMWSEFPVSVITDESARHEIGDLQEKITSLQRQMSARKGAVGAEQAAWERQLLDAVETVDTIDPKKFREVISTPVANRTVDQQRLLEIATLRSPESAVSTPETLPGLHAWYQAASLDREAREEGTPILVWPDDGPQRLHLETSSPDSTQPTYVSTGFQGGPALHFTRPTDELKTSENFGLSGDISYTVFFVAEFHLNDPPDRDIQTAYLFGTDKGAGSIQFLEIDSRSTKYRLDIGSAANLDAETKSLPQDAPVIVSARKKRAQPIKSTQISVNGQPHEVTGPETGISVIPGPLHLGYATLKVSPAMDVAEMIVFDRVLEDEEERAIGYQLSRKYEIDSNYKPNTAKPVVSLVSIAPESRNVQQRQQLRDYYVKHYDQPYREAHAKQTSYRKQLEELKAAHPSVMVLAPQEQEKPSDLSVYVRGNYNTPGEPAPRRFLQIIEGTDHPAIETTGSGRLELARWIAGPDHPLTPRVLVNRIWKAHFGKGIVATSGNFGELGTRPSHPQLLDWLASRFLENNGSVKQLHKMILLSSTYGQAHVANSRADTIDPENKLLWRFPRRRLEAEPLRDSILAVSGGLDKTLYGQFKDWYSPYADVVDEGRGLIALAKTSSEMAAYDSGRRSIYLPVSRNQLYEMFSLFDYSDPSAVMADRVESTVAPQALFMMNNEMVHHEARSFAARLLAIPDANDERRIRQANRMAFAREASQEEIREAIAYLSSYEKAKRKRGAGDEQSRLAAWQSYCQLLFCQNEFMYVD